MTDQERIHELERQVRNRELVCSILIAILTSILVSLAAVLTPLMR